MSAYLAITEKNIIDVSTYILNSNRKYVRGCRLLKCTGRGRGLRQFENRCLSMLNTAKFTGPSIFYITINFIVKVIPTRLLLYVQRTITQRCQCQDYGKVNKKNTFTINIHQSWWTHNFYTYNYRTRDSWVQNH